MFLNLSSHPSAGWCRAQLVAAQALGGTVIDEPFPEVPPEASPEEVARLGRELVNKVSSLKPAAAMVQGEYALAFYLVRELELLGIPCYAATTRRVAEVSRLPDGSTQKVARFEFVQFRRYL